MNLTTENKQILMLVSAIVAVLAIWQKEAILTLVGPRGIRNNNPGNIRKSSDHWQGLADEQKDSAFFTFTTPEYGIRAMTKIIKRYVNEMGLFSIRKIINRWAPPSENNTSAYVKQVSAAVGLDPDLPFTLEKDLQAIITAMIKHENGIQPYSAATIAAGIKLA